MPEQSVASDDLFEPRMPETDARPDLDRVFDEARQAAASDIGPKGEPGRQVVLITPGRMLMFLPCPKPGSIHANMVEQMERLISPKVKRKIVAIAYTELKAVRGGLAKAIPFFGMLSGMAYIGHAVWIFEGHRSALAAGCKGADILIVDGGMTPFLADDWQQVAASGSPKIQIYVHDRATHGLRKAP